MMLYSECSMSLLRPSISDARDRQTADALPACLQVSVLDGVRRLL